MTSSNRTEVEQANTICVRPIYDARRQSLRSQLWGVFADGVLTVITLRYPSHLLRNA